MSCLHESCDRPSRSAGYCGTHYKQFRESGWTWDIWSRGNGIRKGTKRKELVGYEGMHERVKVKRGKASEHPCFWCGGSAKHWAYLHNDPDEVVTKSGPMSLNVDNYEPACVSCHRLFDYKVLTSKA